MAKPLLDFSSLDTYSPSIWIKIDYRGRAVGGAVAALPNHAVAWNFLIAGYLLTVSGVYTE